MKRIQYFYCDDHAPQDDSAVEERVVAYLEGHQLFHLGRSEILQDGALLPVGKGNPTEDRDSAVPYSPALEGCQGHGSGLFFPTPQE